MIHEILQNEISALNTYKKSSKRAKSLFNNNNICFASDGNLFGEYFFTALCLAKAEDKPVYYLSDEARPETPFLISGDDNTPGVISELPDTGEKSMLFFSIDCTDKKYESEAELNSVCARLEKYLSFCAENKNFRLVYLPLVASPDNLPEGVTAVAEREWDYLLSIKKELTFAEKLYLKTEALCRCFVGKKGADAIITRINNVFGPELDYLPGISLKEILNDTLSRGAVCITDEDCNDQYSGIYMSDAARAVIKAAAEDKSGQVYNVSNFTVSSYLIKRALYENFREDFGLSCNISNKQIPCPHGVFVLKLRHIKWKPAVSLSEAVYRTWDYYLARPYDMMRRIPVYTGRLERIRQLEINTLRFVDKVCRENGIKYFLAGGSLLGAIRHGDMIPWDDDLDIGMLREDFEKFRKVCPGLVPENMAYASPQNDSGSHYQFDKIRLRGTYFSTNYSSNFRIEDGIFLDVIIYDQTSNSEWLSKRQINHVANITKMLNVRWRRKPRKGPYYQVRKVAVALLNQLPLSFFHHWFERAVRRYEKKKNAAYLIDGIGQNIKKGRFPKEWLTETEYMKFGDIEAPVPKGYDGYLTHFYGPHYMELLPISQRTSGHSLARIDLGSYLCGNEWDKNFRDVALDGELYEEEK